MQELKKIDLNTRAKVYDKPGTLDRYTVIIGPDAYGMSEYPTDPRGFNQYIGKADEIKDAGKLLPQIPEILTLAIRERLGKQQLARAKSHHGAKDVYLIGCDEEGAGYWLEAPSWDCGWYWGFGYIEQYTSQNPETARDINSHQHAGGLLIGRDAAADGGYCHNPYDAKALKLTTFDEAEGWELGELFAQFEHLKEAAEFWGRGKMHVSDTKAPNWKDAKLERKINREILPAIFARIIEILSPDPDKEPAAAVYGKMAEAEKPENKGA